MAPSAAQPEFAFTRIARNRLAYVLAVVLLMGAAAPLVLGGGYGLAALVVRLATGRTRLIARQVQYNQRLLAQMRELPIDGLACPSLRHAGDRPGRFIYENPVERLERQLGRERAALAANQAADQSLLWKLLPATVGGLVAALAFLYWAAGPSPAVRLLAFVEAVPAGDDVAEATRLIAALCARANLPPPKLFVIHSTVPYTLSAAVDSHHAMLAITRGALNLLDQRELEAVLAHEISHIGNQDIRLNALMASAALMIRLPLTALRQQWSGDIDVLRGAQAGRQARERVIWRSGIGAVILFGILALALSPVAIYIFLVVPIAGFMIRAFASHDREFLADFDAAWLTGNPEGLVSALAKIGAATTGACESNPAFQYSCVGGAGTASGWIGGSFAPAHASPSQRIQRLAELFGAARFTGLEGAIRTGQQYARSNEDTGEGHLERAVQDDLAALRQGSALGRVHRLLASAEIFVYASDTVESPIITRLKPGDLFVLFDDMGRMLPVSTADQTWGYIDRRTERQPLPGVLPHEVYDPAARAAALEALAQRDAAAAERRAAPSAPGPLGLTREQLWIVVGFAAAVFVGITILMVMAAGK